LPTILHKRPHAPDFLPGNRIELLNNGAAFFPALLADIAAAQTEIHLETYIFANDSTGRQVAAALAHAARRGVAVHVLVDGYGAASFIDDFGAALQQAGVYLRVYRPELQRFRLRRHRLRRLHRKLASIDGRVAYVGGINILDDYNCDCGNDTPLDAPRHDYAVRIEGPLLTPIHSSMRRLWHLVSWANLKRRGRPSRHATPDSRVHGPMAAAFIIRDNLRHRHDIENAYLAALQRAQKEVLIANAYFLPGRRFRQALMAAARRGVRITLLLQGRVEYLLQHYATQAMYGQLLAAGIQIHEYQRGFLHAKVAVIDDDWATVGSSNIDPFSLLLAREANVVVHNADFARQLRDSLRQAIQNEAQKIDPAGWRKQSWLHRGSSWLALAMVRLLVGLTGYGDKS
jgi:cardiolipin synthase